MSTDYLTLGPTPSNETCHPNTGDSKMISLELSAYRDQLYRVMEKEFGNVAVSIRRKSFPHEMGSYSEICVIYDEDNQEAIQQAFWLEDNIPEEWDDNAKQYLKDNNYVAWKRDPSYEEMMQREDDYETINCLDDLSSVCEDKDQPTQYCESCHTCGHGPVNCPARLWINQPNGKRIESEPKQHLLPGEVLRLVLPTGQILEVEHTSDTFSITIDDYVLFDAELVTKWEVNFPEHMKTIPFDTTDSSFVPLNDDETHPGWVDDQSI